MQPAPLDFEIQIREATCADLPLLLNFIRAMAAFEKLPVSVTEETLQESLFGDRPAAFSLLAFSAGQPVAYAVYFFSFSTMLGKRCMWLDDVFVDANFRGKGVGKAMMAYLADIALANHCGRFEWMVLDWNLPAVGLYKQLGASIYEDWHLCRLDAEGLLRVAQQGSPLLRRANMIPKKDG